MIPPLFWAIDPALGGTGIVCMQRDPAHATGWQLVHFREFVPARLVGKRVGIRKADLETQQVIALCRQLSDIAVAFYPRYAVLELPSGCAFSLRAVRSLAQASAGIVGYMAAKSIPLEWFDQSEVKACVLGDLKVVGGKKAKEHIADIVRGLWPQVDRAVSSHITDALGLALTAIRRSPTVRILSEQG